MANALPDLVLAWLRDQAGVSNYTIADLLNLYDLPTNRELGNLGYTGAYNDRLHAYLIDQLTIIPGHTFWRISITEKQQNELSDAREIEFLVDGVDQATGGTATANDGFWGDATRAFDNDPSTRWTTGITGGTSDWIQYEFVDPVWPEQVTYQVAAGARGPKDVVIAWSDNGTDWTTALSVLDMAAWSDDQKRTWDIPAQE